MLLYLKQQLASRFAILDYIRRAHRLPKLAAIPFELMN